MARKTVGEVVEVGDLRVVLVREPVDRQEPLVRVEGEVPRVVVGEVDRVRLVADDEKLDEAEKRSGVSVAGIVLVVDDLLHRPPGADAERLEFDLNDGDTVDQQHDVVTVVAVVRIDAELVDDLEGVLAPVLDVDEGVVERRTVVADECFHGSEGPGGFVHVRGDDFVEEPLELPVGEADAIECLELLPEVRFERGSVADVGAVFVLQVTQFIDEGLFKIAFGFDSGHYGETLLSEVHPKGSGRGETGGCCQIISTHFYGGWFCERSTGFQWYTPRTELARIFC